MKWLIVDRLINKGQVDVFVKCLNLIINVCLFLRTILQEQKSSFSTYIIYHYFYPDIFMFGIDREINLED